MAQLTPRFSADRTVREYTGQQYLPAAKAFIERTANNGEMGKKLTDRLHELEQNWDSMRFGKVSFKTVEKLHKFEARVYFNDVDPDTVQVELFANRMNGEGQIMQKMMRGAELEGKATGFSYHISVNATLPATHFTARIIPYMPGVSVPLEISRILWQR